jgi:hypothetical protein
MASPLENSRGGEYTYYHYPAANTLATVTLADPGDSRQWRIVEILFGFDATPTSAVELAIQLDGATDIIKIPVADAGPKKLSPAGMFGQQGAQPVINLPAGGAGVTGYLSVQVQKVPLI